jgi:hypothetical protein
MSQIARRPEDICLLNGERGPRPTVHAKVTPFRLHAIIISWIITALRVRVRVSERAVRLARTVPPSLAELDIRPPHIRPPQPSIPEPSPNRV